MTTRIMDDVVNAGDLFLDGGVVGHKNSVTSRHPFNIPAFIVEISKALFC